MIYNGILSSNKKNDIKSCPWYIIWDNMQVSMYSLIPFGKIKPPNESDTGVTLKEMMSDWGRK